MAKYRWFRICLVTIEGAFLVLENINGSVSPGRWCMASPSLTAVSPGRRCSSDRRRCPGCTAGRLAGGEGRGFVVVMTRKYARKLMLLILGVTFHVANHGGDRRGEGWGRQAPRNSLKSDERLERPATVWMHGTYPVHWRGSARTAAPRAGGQAGSSGPEGPKGRPQVSPQGAARRGTSVAKPWGLVVLVVNPERVTLPAAPLVWPRRQDWWSVGRDSQGFASLASLPLLHPLGYILVAPFGAPGPSLARWRTSGNGGARPPAARVGYGSAEAAPSACLGQGLGLG
jgi:hypothetical protein